MDFHKNTKKNYDRVMSRVFNRSRSSLRSSSNVTRHEVPSSVRVGAKPSVSAGSSGVFNELPTVLNDYVPDTGGVKVVKRPLVRPKRTLKSLDVSKVKSPSRPPRARGSSFDRNVRARSSVPTVLSNNGEEWSESHVRQCYSSRSHTRLKELKDEIKAFRETDKLLKMRSRLYKSCGVVLDDVGNVAQDKAVQADPEPDKENTSLRCRQWLIALGREDLIEKVTLKNNINYSVCSAHFDSWSIKSIPHLEKDAVPTLFLSNQEQPTRTAREREQDTMTMRHIAQVGESTIVMSRTREGASSYLSKPSISVQIKEEVFDNEENEMVKIKIESHTKQTQTQPIEETAKNHKLSELKDAKLEAQRLTLELMKIKQELEAKNQPITCNEPDDEVVKRFKKLIEWQNKVKNKNKENSYDAKYKLFALNLYYSTPHAYRCLETVLKLPSKNALRQFKMIIPPKLDNRVLNTLALKLKSLPEQAKYCTICVDEMTLKRKMYYNTKWDEVIGFHNVNGKAMPAIASSTYVMMLQGIYVKWELPIAYAFLATSKHYKEIDAWLNEIIGKLSASGIIVKAIISNQESNFDKFAKEVMKVTVEKPYFMYNNTKIYYICDIPRLVKSVRNHLIDCDFIFEEKTISWKHIIELYKDQKERDLRLISNITDAHIHPNKFQKLEVELAVQVLTRSVAAALHAYIDLGKFTEEARSTANFIEAMNNLFDILNSSNMKSAFRLSKDQITVLNDANEMFAVLETINRKTGEINTGHMKTFLNFQMSIQSIVLLQEDLQKDGLKHIQTRRLNQDNLENFFSSVRQHGGSSSKLTPIQFRRAFSKLFVGHMIKSSPYGNCKIDIYDTLLNNAEDMTKMQLINSERPQKSSVSLSGETDYQFDLPDDNALTYVSGYLFFKCVSKHNCPVINQISKSAAGFEKTNLFKKYKSYNKQSGFYGCLKMPPREFTEYIQHLENIFIQNFEKLVQNNPGGKLLELFATVPPLTPCSCFPIDYLLKLFARFRIYTTIKYNISQFKDGKKEMVKYFKVRHL